MEPTSYDKSDAKKIMKNLDTLSFKIGLQSFPDIDQPIIFNVEINEKIFVDIPQKLHFSILLYVVFIIFT